MVLNDSLFAQIKWFRPPGKIYGELWAMVLPLHLFILGSVSSWQILLFLFCFLPNLNASEMPFPSSSQSPNTPMHTTNIRYTHSENWKNIFKNVCRDGVEISHKTPETQFTINDSHIRWARGQSILLDNTHWAGWAQTRVSLPIMWAASATATRLLCFGLSDN